MATLLISANFAGPQCPLSTKSGHSPRAMVENLSPCSPIAAGEQLTKIHRLMLLIGSPTNPRERLIANSGKRSLARLR
jgi:hypothetical protein